MSGCVASAKRSAVDGGRGSLARRGAPHPGPWRVTAAARSSALLAALRGAEPALPEALAVFDRIAGAPAPEPDFIEWSARVAGACDPFRLTYYFDAERHGAPGLLAAFDRFASLGAALGAAVPAALAGAFASVASRPEVLQVVLGVDESPDEGRRVKLYVVLRAAAAGAVDALVEAAGARRPPDLDAAKVYIVGLDVGAAGLTDAKLYFRLDRGRLGRVVANLREVADLVATARDVVLQRCLLRDRSQLYLHASDAFAIGRHLARRAREDAAAARLVALHAAASGRLARVRLEPWILSFAFRDHRLRLDASNVYFHLLDIDPARGEQR